jgi:hypothetical protein
MFLYKASHSYATEMLYIDERYPHRTHADVARPSRKEMRAGVFVLQSHMAPKTVYYTTTGIPKAVTFLNQTLRHMKVRRQNLYMSAWGAQKHHRSFYVRFLKTAEFDDLRKTHSDDVIWVDAGS